MKCSDIIDISINKSGDYIVNLVSLDNSNNNICKVNIDYSANIIAENTNYININIGVYRLDRINNNIQLVGNIYKYTSVSDFKEYFSIFTCDDQICKGCYSYIVKYTINDQIITGDFKVINSNIRLIAEVI